MKSMSILIIALISPLALSGCKDSQSSGQAASEPTTSYSGKVSFPKEAMSPSKPVAELSLLSYRVKRDPGGKVMCLPILGCAATKENTFIATAKIKNAGTAAANGNDIKLIVMKDGSAVSKLSGELADIDPGFTKTINFSSDDNYESGSYTAKLQYTQPENTYEQDEAERDAQAAREDAVERAVAQLLTEYNSVKCDFDSDLKFVTGAEVECSASLTAEKSSWDAMRKVIVKFTDDNGSYSAQVVKR